VNKSNILDAILANISDGITLFDSDLKLLAVNARVHTLMEFSPDQVQIGDSIEVFFRVNAKRGEYGPGDPEEQIRERMEIARRFEPHDFERTRPDGTVIRIRGTPVPEGGFVTTYTDVTERKRAETALRDSEGRLRTIIDNYPWLLTLKDLEGRYLFVNEYFARSRNVSVEQAIGMSAAELETPEQAAIVDAHDREVIEKAEIVTYERNTIAQDGTRGMRSVMKFPAYDADGNMMGVGTISFDITERKRAEAALRESEERLGSMFENSPTAIMMKNLDGRYAYMNRHFRGGSVSLNRFPGFYKWISTSVMLQPRLAATL